ncbi:hypothetical protein [Pareuzebyella sediminis]|uniref:hypothetical protein n=1 Tax=Pareuzebyella sediminis TaxID=2607998 RepID=UPI0011ECA34D|nr:hypothetical protein [Pareuzebyella sediminis]
MDTLYKKIILLIGSILLYLPAQAQEKVSKELSKVFELTNNGDIHIENKYGNISVFGWEKEEVSLRITIRVTHKKRDNAQDLLNRIKPILHHSENFLSVSYEIEEKGSSFFSQLFEKANPFDFDRSNIQIDFTLKVPSKTEMEISNKFGDVIIEDWNGTLDAQVEHGNIWINENLKNATVSLEFGKLHAKDISFGRLELKNGELNMNDAKNLRLYSSGSTVELGTIGVLDIDSNKDELMLKWVDNLFGVVKFGRVEVHRLQKDLDIDLKISDFVVDKVGGTDVDISITQESSDITLNITDFSHQFRAVLEEGLVRLPKTYREVDSKILDKGKKLREIYATYGDHIRGTILIEGKKGVVLLKEL